MGPEAQPGICLEGGLEPKVNFFAQNPSNSGLVLNKPMQLKRITEGPGCRAPASGKFCDFAAKKQQF